VPSQIGYPMSIVIACVAAINRVNSRHKTQELQQDVTEKVISIESCFCLPVGSSIANLGTAVSSTHLARTNWYRYRATATHTHACVSYRGTIRTRGTRTDDVPDDVRGNHQPTMEQAVSGGEGQ